MTKYFKNRNKKSDSNESLFLFSKKKKFVIFLQGVARQKGEH